MDASNMNTDTSSMASGRIPNIGDNAAASQNNKANEQEAGTLELILTRPVTEIEATLLSDAKEEVKDSIKKLSDEFQFSTNLNNNGRIFRLRGLVISASTDVSLMTDLQKQIDYYGYRIELISIKLHYLSIVERFYESNVPSNLKDEVEEFILRHASPRNTVLPPRFGNSEPLPNRQEYLEQLADRLTGAEVRGVVAAP